MSNAESSGLLQRYRRVWRQSWRQRREMDAPKRLAHEVQFLPAALELQDKPSHPAPRIFMWAIMAFAALALLWACLGKIYVVATASGKIIPSGKTKTIQSSETAVVKAIHVRDGQSVKAGQLLLELDSKSADADVGRVRSDLLAARIDSARAAAMLDAINQRKPPRDLTGTIVDADPMHVLAAERWLQGQYQEYRSSLDLVDAEIQQRQADIQAARIQVTSLQKTLPIATKLASDYENLLKKQYIARHAYLEKEQARLDLERQLSVQQASVLQSTAARQEAERRREGVVAQTRRAMLDLLQQADQKIASFNQDLTKARYQEDLTPAQPLMVLVPDGQPVEVEAMLENKDVGFVRAGQPVTVKVETFTFTKYGTIDGEVISVSNDAIEDEKRGLIYSSKIRLNSDTLNVNCVDIKLSPGMAVTAEVKTNKRRVIEYFLSPLQQHALESLRER
ncbi:HlyD family efflux transporter periplasmic adaptor subunit [Pseudomonas savastanoi pv. phaseolicola]|uniref:Type I secretion membrane fusion protein, HlyD family n=3 Tax=Pseudomonas savastanoi TaxID=29438 RepID=A0A3M6DIW2_PSESG|nr:MULTISPECIES: HlyD family efflux transporter periplasmic adaptor subunit [Pseudomonas]AAZ37294.1 type I secretion membrane fusion protein, HlyD family [Pseudomonas savastanoi pv. phaseolicola 1448A]KPB38152.1 Type I secretion membrane fusion protein [Pseudomonas savastanoi pv. phaseolicola]KPB44465.1 Type I secretion membrane fusion protein [Pseudomonas savastanoi pv. phaseolicola]KPB57436.1 Type I secretion membrane fusion protein [Pseudomonas savastanoi pv. phaseolicola]KPB66441.1 Type I 